jgi:hypothetical protein
MYHVELKNVRQYQLCVGFVGNSYSFCQAVSMLTLKREVTVLSCLRTICDIGVNASLYMDANRNRDTQTWLYLSNELLQKFPEVVSGSV